MIFILLYCNAGISGIVKGIVKDFYNVQGGGANLVVATYSEGTALGAEIIGTFVLVYSLSCH
ncbi:conserved hypothetical protein [Ricinus communis]|uniref:Uncharacterized protein n=1 Tax=Ricinus communis TaxID=3988 RepID=B9R8E0_RICCO|nr:conserved hypothetical protein [Ricinus communis]